jgi:hypothetical protein
LETYRWKSRRTIHYAEKYFDDEIADVTGVAFRQADEKLRGEHGEAPSGSKPLAACSPVRVELRFALTSDRDT